MRVQFSEYFLVSSVYHAKAAIIFASHQNEPHVFVYSQLLAKYFRFSNIYFQIRQDVRVLRFLLRQYSLAAFALTFIFRCTIKPPQTFVFNKIGNAI